MLYVVVNVVVNTLVSVVVNIVVGCVVVEIGSVELFTSTRSLPSQQVRFWLSLDIIHLPGRINLPSRWQQSLAGKIALSTQ